MDKKRIIWGIFDFIGWIDLAIFINPTKGARVWLSGVELAIISFEKLLFWIMLRSFEDLKGLWATTANLELCSPLAFVYSYSGQ